MVKESCDGSLSQHVYPNEQTRTNPAGGLLKLIADGVNVCGA
jgi:hypothetical protein